MNKYAILVTADYKFLPGVNAILNGIVEYGNEVDYHLLYWDNPGGPFEQYVDRVKMDGRFEFFKPIDLKLWAANPSRNWMRGERTLKPKDYLKFWRHYYPLELLNYKAIAVFDADMMIVNDIMDYFEIAEKTGRILVPRNTGIYAQEIDNYSETAFTQSYAPPCHSMPLFYDPGLYYPLFQKVPPIAFQIGRGEMVAINYVFHKHEMYDKLILLPNSLWLATRWRELQYDILYGDRRHVTVAGDRCFSIHGRWWHPKKLLSGYPPLVYGKKNFDNFNEMFKHLNTLHFPIDWEWDST